MVNADVELLKEVIKKLENPGESLPNSMRKELEVFVTNANPVIDAPKKPSANAHTRKKKVVRLNRTRCKQAMAGQKVTQRHRKKKKNITRKIKCRFTV